MGEGGRDVPKNQIVTSTVSILAIALLLTHPLIVLFFLNCVYVCACVCALMRHSMQR